MSELHKRERKDKISLQVPLQLEYAPNSGSWVDQYYLTSILEKLKELLALGAEQGVALVTNIPLQESLSRNNK